MTVRNSDWLLDKMKVDNWFKETGLIFLSETRSPGVEPRALQGFMISLVFMLQGYSSSPFSGKLILIWQAELVMFFLCFRGTLKIRASLQLFALYHG